MVFSHLGVLFVCRSGWVDPPDLQTVSPAYRGTPPEAVRRNSPNSDLVVKRCYVRAVLVHEIADQLLHELGQVVGRYTRNTRNTRNSIYEMSTKS